MEVEKIIEFFVGIFTGIAGIPFIKEIIVFIISMVPILELRGGILLAAAFDMNPVASFIICLIGNIIVIPIALFLLEKIFKLLRKISFFNKFITWFEKKCLSKREQLDKYGYFGLFLFVGIPLPGTGVWTGCFLASLLNMDKKKSFLAAMAGVLLAGGIMMLVSFGILKNIF